MGIPMFDVSAYARSDMGAGRIGSDAVLGDTGPVDVNGLSIDEIGALPPGELGKALDRVLADSGDMYNGFNNSI
jgi:FXSXX-COOH protein